MMVLKPDPINSAWSKTYIWTPRSTFYDASEQSYIWKWPWTMLLLLVYIRQFWNLSSQFSIVKNIYLDTNINLLWCLGAELHPEIALDHVVGVVGVGVHLAVLQYVRVNSARSKTYIWQDQPSTMPGSWVTSWSGPGPCCWQFCWRWCTSGSSETCSSQLSIVKNRYLDTKIYLLWCQEAEVHLEVALDYVLGSVVAVGVHLAVLKPVPVNSA